MTLLAWAGEHQFAHSKLCLFLLPEETITSARSNANYFVLQHCVALDAIWRASVNNIQNQFHNLAVKFKINYYVFRYCRRVRCG